MKSQPPCPRPSPSEKGWLVYVRYTDPTGRSHRIRKAGPASTRREAEAYERQLLASLIEGSYDTFDPQMIPTFEVFAKEWVANHVEVNNKPSTQRTAKSSLRSRLVPFFGRMRLDEINERDIARFKAKTLREVKPVTVNKHLGNLSSMLNTAKRWGCRRSRPRHRVAQTEGA